MVPFGSIHEILHVIGQMPGQVIVFTNYKIFCYCSNEGNFHLDIRKKVVFLSIKCVCVCVGVVLVFDCCDLLGFV